MYNLQDQSVMNRPLIIFIVGTTAVGKTKLSVELCKAIGGEVINCDSKQLYKHASIMTAKANHEQTQGVPHHMLDVLELNENCYNRNRYYSEAMACIKQIKARGKVPVVIGGTNYYLETLLYNINMKGAENGQENQNQSDNQKQITKQKLKVQGEATNNVKQDSKNKQENVTNRITKEQLMAMTRQERYSYLEQVDPIMATKLHRNDQTRITNFLSRYIETGIPPSKNYKPLSHELRFPEQTVLFWIRNSNKKQLHELMETRISKMVDTGGLKEILSVFKYADMNGLLEGLKMGALQSIGYKQFLEVYQEVKQILSNEQFDSSSRTYEQIEKLVDESMDKIKHKLDQATSKSVKSNKKVPLLEKCNQVLVRNTVDYSKRQVTWLRNRIFACEQNRDNFFVLEIGANKGEHNLNLMARFDKNVKGRALNILKQVQQQGIGSIKQNAKQFNESKHESLTQWKKYYCQICKIEVNGSREWDEHMRSRKHRKSQYASKKSIKNQMRRQKNARQNQQNDSQNQSENSQRQKQEQQQEKQIEQRQEDQMVSRVSKKKQ